MGANIDQGKETEIEYDLYSRARLHQRSAPVSPEGSKREAVGQMEPGLTMRVPVGEDKGEAVWEGQLGVGMQVK